MVTLSKLIWISHLKRSVLLLFYIPQSKYIVLNICRKYYPFKSMAWNHKHMLIQLTHSLKASHLTALSSPIRYLLPRFTSTPLHIHVLFWMTFKTKPICLSLPDNSKTANDFEAFEISSTFSNLLNECSVTEFPKAFCTMPSRQGKYVITPLAWKLTILTWKHCT